MPRLRARGGRGRCVQQGAHSGMKHRGRETVTGLLVHDQGPRFARRAASDEPRVPRLLDVYTHTGEHSRRKFALKNISYALAILHCRGHASRGCAKAGSRYLLIVIARRDKDTRRYKSRRPTRNTPRVGVAIATRASTAVERTSLLEPARYDI